MKDHSGSASDIASAQRAATMRSSWSSVRRAVRAAGPHPADAILRGEIACSDETLNALQEILEDRLGTDWADSAGGCIIDALEGEPTDWDDRQTFQMSARSASEWSAFCDGFRMRSQQPVTRTTSERDAFLDGFRIRNQATAPSRRPLSRPRARGAGRPAARRTPRAARAGPDAGDPDEPEPPRRLQLWWHPRYGAVTRGLLEVLLRTIKHGDPARRHDRSDEP